MPNQRNLIFLFFFSVLLPNVLFSQNFLKTSGRNIINQNGDTIVLRGIGLGGWMVQEGYMMAPGGFSGTQFQIRDKITDLIGEEETEKFYDNWLKNHVRKIDIDSMKSWGFNLVRVPIHYNLFTAPIEDELFPGSYTEIEKGYKLLDSLLEWCKANEMYMMIDLHAAPGGQGYNADISDYDTSKYSLWESGANQDKTVELWKRLSQRYKNEEWVAGYDLINEPNWNLPGNKLLKELYVRITDVIRAEGDEHILFIEGNWFANDFTGLVPPWDDNMVYSPHKYWSPVDEEYLDWLIQDTLTTPIFVGETGENSNLWYRDAIKLYEDNKIGWAWWPLKRIDAIQPPLSINYNEKYKKIVDYWNTGNNRPTKEEAIEGLRQLTEDIKFENCFYHKDIIDAMFRQPFSDETVPYADNIIPGKIYATDFDMGVMGSAYYDAGADANYGGDFSPWNNGWGLRNDNVDIQVSNDSLSNGFHVGWTETDEWMKYSFKLDSSGSYNIDLHYATESSDSKFSLSIDDENITDVITLESTGSWEKWNRITVDSVIINENDNSFKFNIEKGTFNFSFIEFDRIGDLSLVNTNYVSSLTTDGYSIKITTNKNIDILSEIENSDFNIKVNGEDVQISSITLLDGSRSFVISLVNEINPGDIIQVSYSGDGLKSVDGLQLNNFSLETVDNTISYIHDIPGKIEAEHYFFQKGISTEAVSDFGGGLNIGNLDDGDYADYKVRINSSGTYNVTYRSAADSEWSNGGQVEIGFVDTLTNKFSSIQNVILPLTNGWQDWENTSKAVDLPEGNFIMRLRVVEGPFNLNWISFDDSVSVGIPIPGYLEAEDYISQSGTSLEMTEDEGGGQNIGYLDSADYVDYIVNATEEGFYDISYRVASDGSQDYANGGIIELQLLKDSLDPQVLHTVSFPATNGWQDWRTFSNFPKVFMEKGDQKIRLFFTKTPFNLNWILFERFDGEILGVENENFEINIYPNPANDLIKVKSSYNPQNPLKFMLIDKLGRPLLIRESFDQNKIDEVIELNQINSGLFILLVYDGNHLLSSKKVIINR